jgi:PUA domain protein
VAVMAEGKQHALAVGITSLSTEDIAKVNKGVGIENCHYLNDGLWQMKPVK